ncbi:hypothetical protein BVX99_01875 [bacterium F16]|nr:hypothetical protein BVX99_01875 [bacterium F16]
MRIAIDLGEYFTPAWKISAGALEYETLSRVTAGHEDVNILLPHSSFIAAEDKDPSSWDGVILREPRPELNIPQVLISSGYGKEHVSVTTNNHEIGRLAGAQFVSMGLRSLAFFGWDYRPPSVARWRGFSQYLESREIEPVFIHLGKYKKPWEVLPKIPKPCGILAFNDNKALWLLSLCKELGLEVPRDVHIISVDNSPACMESTPTLSSIAIPFALIGYRAAQLCEKMVNGEAVESIQIPPSGLIIRDSVMVEKGDMRSAASVAHYLRTNLSYPIQMEDIARRSSISRRRLERMFRSAYGASPIAYLRELRLEQAKVMLRSSDAPLKTIVEKCGFSNTIHLCHIFKRTIGLTPMDYRKAHSNNP